MNTQQRLIISLFDHSRTWADAFEDLGVSALSVDIQERTHPHHLVADLSNDAHFATVQRTVVEFCSYHSITNVGLVCAPPCTAFTKAGAHLWAVKDSLPPDDVHSTKYALKLFARCFEMRDYLISRWNLTLDFWCIENPPGRLYKKSWVPNDKNIMPGIFQRILGPPVMEFHPYEFGGWYPHDPIMASGREFANRSEMSKLTYLWGNFMPPEKKSLGAAKSLNMDNQPGKRDITSRLSSSNKAARQQTPRGFATAFASAQLTKE